MRRARRADLRTIWPATLETVWDHLPPDERARLDRGDWEKHFRKRIESHIEGDRTEAWIAESPAGEFLGYVILGPGGGFLTPETQGFIWDVWVAPAHRRKGVGRFLIGWAIDWARRRGYRKIKLEVSESNVIARRLYEAMGFRAERQYMGRTLEGSAPFVIGRNSDDQTVK